MANTAKDLYERFRGAVARRFTRIGIRYGRRWLTHQQRLNILIPSELAIIGRVSAIEYDCVRDGKRVEARHPFAPGAKPILAAGAGRGEFFILTTASKFTDRGFMDYDRHGRAIDYNEKTGKVTYLE